jgi:hypothetical protein
VAQGIDKNASFGSGSRTRRQGGQGRGGRAESRRGGGAATGDADKLGTGERSSELPRTEPPKHRRAKELEGTQQPKRRDRSCAGRDSGESWTLEDAGPGLPGPEQRRRGIRHEPSSTSQENHLDHKNMSPKPPPQPGGRHRRRSAYTEAGPISAIPAEAPSHPSKRLKPASNSKRGLHQEAKGRAREEQVRAMAAPLSRTSRGRSSSRKMFYYVTSTMPVRWHGDIGLDGQITLVSLL